MSYSIGIGAGGTGGHLFPALALAAEMRTLLPQCEVFFLGGGLAKSRYFDHASFEFMDVACGSLNRKDPLSLAKSFGNICRGIYQSRAWLKAKKPDLVVGFGSYYAFPPLIAAKMAGIPLMLHAADAIPGRVVRWLAPYARLTALQFAEASHHIKGDTAVAKMPLRANADAAVDAASARKAFGLQESQRTLLVFGGSQGARRINELISVALDAVDPTVQVLHFTGDAAAAEIARERYSKQGRQACVKPFETRMHLAWSAADLVVGRSGASTVAEMQAFTTPALLIPYPHAMDDHQARNADIMVAKGAAIKLLESDASVEKLRELLSHLLQPARLNQMREVLVHLKLSQNAPTLGELIVDVLRKEKNHG